MATPPQGPKNGAGEALPGPSRSLLRLAKVTQKRGFPNGFPTVWPAVFRRLNSGFAGGFPTVFRQLPGGLPVVRRRFCRWFDRGFLVVSGRFGRRFYRRFDGDAVPLDQPRSGSGVPLHPKETVGQFRTHFQAYKPSIWEEESFRRYMESREEALPAGTQRPWWKFWGTG